MENEGLVIEDEFHSCDSEPAGSETEPLLRPAPPTYEMFRAGRETQQSSTFTRFILPVFQVCFGLLGLWGHRAWNNIPRVLIVIVCTYYIIFYIICDPFSPHCRGNLTEEVKQIQCHSYKTGYITDAIFTTASILSWFAFIICCMKAKNIESALVFPSQSLVEDIGGKGDIFILFLSFLIGNALLTSSVVLDMTDLILYTTNASVVRRPPIIVGPLNFKISPIKTSISPLATKTTNTTPTEEDLFRNPAMWSVMAIRFFLPWVSLNICHIFTASCLALGVFAQDALRLIRDLQNGTLNDVIRVYEDQCTVVFNTVSFYSVWFAVHMFTHCAGVIFFSIKFCVELEYLSKLEEYKTQTMRVAYSCVLLFFFVYLLLLPCVYAARITSHCTGIYEKINRTISHDWNEGHPFKDRLSIALFICYAKVRRCGFKVGNITFDSSLAWLSFLFGLVALLYPVIKQGYGSQ